MKFAVAVANSNQPSSGKYFHHTFQCDVPCDSNVSFMWTSRKPQEELGDCPKIRQDIGGLQQAGASSTTVSDKQILLFLIHSKKAQIHLKF